MLGAARHGYALGFFRAARLFLRGPGFHLFCLALGLQAALDAAPIYNPVMSQACPAAPMPEKRRHGQTRGDLPSNSAGGLQRCYARL